MLHLVVIAVMLGQPATLVDRTLAIVGGRTITLSDARTAIRLGLVEGAEVDVAVVERLVARELMLREADRYTPPPPAADAVAARMEEVRARAGSEAGLASILDAGGFTEARLTGWLRDDLRIAAYLQQRFAQNDRRADLIADWVADLRRRTDVTVFEP